METRKYKTGQIRELPTDDSRTVRFTVSDESKDRHNSIVPVEAWDLENFKENPIAGWGHGVYGGWRPPDPDDIIGSWDVWIEGKELVGDLTFEDAETNPKADKLFRKVKNRTISAVSVGFLPHKLHEGDSEKTEGESDGVTYYDEAELVEVSLVVIPSNPNARKKAIENGDIPELMEELISEALGDKLTDEEIEKLTIKGFFNVLRGGDVKEIKEADSLDSEDLAADTGEAEKARIEQEKEKYKLLIKLMENDT